MQAEVIFGLIIYVMNILSPQKEIIANCHCGEHHEIWMVTMQYASLVSQASPSYSMLKNWDLEEPRDAIYSAVRSEMILYHMHVVSTTPCLHMVALLLIVLSAPVRTR